MKKLCIVCLTGLLFLTACENTGSSTVGSYDKEETSPSSENNESEKMSGEEKGKTETVTTDTLETSGVPASRIGTKASADSMK